MRTAQPTEIWGTTEKGQAITGKQHTDRAKVNGVELMLPLVHCVLHVSVSGEPCECVFQVLRDI